MTVILDRVWSDGDGTRGVLIIDRPLFVTLEPEHPIPAGYYTCERWLSPRFHRELFKLTNVAGHYGVEFHTLNVVKQTHLCIGVGMRFGDVTVDGVTSPGILQSEDALDLFMSMMAGVDRFQLTVKEW